MKKEVLEDKKIMNIGCTCVVFNNWQKSTMWNIHSTGINGMSESLLTGSMAVISQLLFVDGAMRK